MYRIDETPDFRALVEQQCAKVSASSQVIYQEIGLAKPDGRWDVTPDQARFTFTEHSGTQRHARYGVIGSYNPNSHSWLWSWAFPDGWMPPAATAAARNCVSWAEKLAALTEPNYLDEHEAHMTMLGAHIMGYPLVTGIGQRHERITLRSANRTDVSQGRPPPTHPSFDRKFVAGTLGGLSLSAPCMASDAMASSWAVRMVVPQSALYFLSSLLR